jgi:hypothetical protein
MGAVKKERIRADQKNLISIFANISMIISILAENPIKGGIPARFIVTKKIKMIFFPDKFKKKNSGSSEGSPILWKIEQIQ